MRWRRTRHDRLAATVASECVGRTAEAAGVEIRQPVLRRESMAGIRRDITRRDVLSAIKRLDEGDAHPFGPSRKFDLVHEGRRYPPKAVLGLAVESRTGRLLRPEEFTGGQHSQCHAVLERLGFEIETKTGVSGVDRSDPTVAKVVIGKLLSAASTSTRKLVLEFLADSIAFAAQNHNDRWGVTLESSHARFNSGQTESVVLWPNSVAVLVKGTERIAGTTLSRAYPSAGGSRLRKIPYDQAARVLRRLRETHNEAMTVAMARKSPSNILEAHSPGVVEYLWRELRRTGAVPAPDPKKGKQRPAIARRRSVEKELSGDKAIMERPDLDETTKHAMVKVRLAQRLFRARLAAARQSCCLTGVKNRNYLRASHIKPWRDCDDRERQDPNNGLLLAPHVDHLFDKGYLSFEDDGTILVSRQLDRKVLEAWGLAGVKKVTPFSVEQAQYLAHHRKHVFERRRD